MLIEARRGGFDAPNPFPLPTSLAGVSLASWANVARPFRNEVSSLLVNAPGIALHARIPNNQIIALIPRHVPSTIATLLSPNRFSKFERRDRFLDPQDRALIVRIERERFVSLFRVNHAFEDATKFSVSGSR